MGSAAGGYGDGGIYELALRHSVRPSGSAITDGSRSQPVRHQSNFAAISLSEYRSSPFPVLTGLCMILGDEHGDPPRIPVAAVAAGKQGTPSSPLGDPVIVLANARRRPKRSAMLILGGGTSILPDRAIRIHSLTRLPAPLFPSPPPLPSPLAAPLPP